MYATRMKKSVMNLIKSKEKYMGGLGEGKGKGN